MKIKSVLNSKKKKKRTKTKQEIIVFPYNIKFCEYVGIIYVIVNGYR